MGAGVSEADLGIFPLPMGDMKLAASGVPGVLRLFYSV